MLHKDCGGSEGGLSPLLNGWSIAQNRPREQNFNALNTAAEVKADSVRLERMICRSA